VDVHTIKQRSFNMSQIKSRDTQCESLFRKYICLQSIRGYRLHAKKTGKPDLYFPMKKLAVFIDGCFWHKCPKCFVKPTSNKHFWNKKIAANVARDKTVNTQLRKEDIHVLRFWEHEIRKDTASCARKLITILNRL